MKHTQICVTLGPLEAGRPEHIYMLVIQMGKLINTGTEVSTTCYEEAGNQKF